MNEYGWNLYRFLNGFEDVERTSMVLPQVYH